VLIVVYILSRLSKFDLNSSETIIKKLARFLLHENLVKAGTGRSRKSLLTIFLAGLSLGIRRERDEMARRTRRLEPVSTIEMCMYGPGRIRGQNCFRWSKILLKFLFPVKNYFGVLGSH
jgi:hypothetical protein